MPSLRFWSFPYCHAVKTREKDKQEETELGEEGGADERWWHFNPPGNLRLSHRTCILSLSSPLPLASLSSSSLQTLSFCLPEPFLCLATHPPSPTIFPPQKRLSVRISQSLLFQLPASYPPLSKEERKGNANQPRNAKPGCVVHVRPKCVAFSWRSRHVV